MERAAFLGLRGGADGGGEPWSGRDQTPAAPPHPGAGPDDGLSAAGAGPAGAGANPAIAAFLARLRPDLAASFTPDQLAAVERHFAMRHRVRHAIDWRRHIRLPFLSGYVILLAGRDNRRA
jgi:hypothetical protein